MASLSSLGGGERTVNTDNAPELPPLPPRPPVPPSAGPRRVATSDFLELMRERDISLDDFGSPVITRRDRFAAFITELKEHPAPVHEFNGPALLPEQIGELALAVSQHPCVQELVLRGCEIDFQQMRSFAIGIATNTTLTSLSVEGSGHKFGNSSLQTLLEALETNPRIIKLRLWRNNITRPGGEILASFVQTHRALEVLDVSANRLGAAGGQLLAKAVATHPCLKHLNLDSNNMGPETAKELARSLAQNKSVTSLKLCWNAIGDQGAEYMAHALRANGTLLKLDLRWNGITTGGARTLKDAVLRNRTLFSLQVVGGCTSEMDKVRRDIDAALVNPPARVKAAVAERRRSALIDSLAPETSIAGLPREVTAPPSALIEDLDVMHRKFAAAKADLMAKEKRIKCLEDEIATRPPPVPPAPLLSTSRLRRYLLPKTPCLLRVWRPEDTELRWHAGRVLAVQSDGMINVELNDKTRERRALLLPDEDVEFTSEHILHLIKALADQRLQAVTHPSNAFFTHTRTASLSAPLPVATHRAHVVENAGSSVTRETWQRVRASSARKREFRQDANVDLKMSRLRLLRQQLQRGGSGSALLHRAAGSRSHSQEVTEDAQHRGTLSRSFSLEDLKRDEEEQLAKSHLRSVIQRVARGAAAPAVMSPPSMEDATDMVCRACSCGEWHANFWRKERCRNCGHTLQQHQRAE